jgi:protocatechuate 3,4-dioxygenase alpha subunit
VIGMTKRDVQLIPTASQTAGPFLHLGFDALCNDVVLSPKDEPSGVDIRGRVIDGDGQPVPDAALEIWQASPDGRYASDDSRGFGRVYTDDSGRFRIATVLPGAVPGADGSTQAPHLVVMLFMRGLLRHLTTRLYFADEPSNESDAILARVPAERRATLVARPAATPGAFEWDVVLQGDGETVFFEW